MADLVLGFSTWTPTLTMCVPAHDKNSLMASIVCSVTAPFQLSERKKVFLIFEGNVYLRMYGCPCRKYVWVGAHVGAFVWVRM